MNVKQGQILTVKNGPSYAAIEDSPESEVRVKAKKIDLHVVENNIEKVECSANAFSVPKSKIAEVSEPIEAVSLALGLIKPEDSEESEEIVEITD